MSTLAVHALEALAGTGPSFMFKVGLPHQNIGLALRSVSTLRISQARYFHPSANTMSGEAPYKVVTTSEAPQAIGPYSQAVIHNGTVFCSGCIPFVPSTMKIVEGDIQAQAQQALDNLLAVLKASGSDKSHVLKTTVFLKDMNEYVNEFFPIT